MRFKRCISSLVSIALFSTTLASFPVKADDTDKYPYTLFAGSSEEGAITISASNVCINGNIATNGTIVSSGNMNVNGTKTENATEEMMYIWDRIDNTYFSGSNVDTYTEDYSYEDTNVNITEPLEVEGKLELTGNINLSTGLKALEDINLNGEVKNTNESVICSETGDIIIDTTNVNLNGLVYAPEGCVDITAQNLNMNNVIIIADTIKVECPNLNANYNSSMGEFIGIESDKDLCIYVMGDYNEENNSIDLTWLTTISDGSFDIEISIDDEVYETYDTVENTDAYSYPLTGQESDLYFKIIQTTESGQTQETFSIVMRKTDSGYTMEFVDSDEDKIPDFVELELGTNLEIKDTDEDGLTDYEEYILTNTDPLVYDSVTSDLSDADADCDEDGLSNIYEVKAGTDPQSEDTDTDTLSDNEEINVYSTSPLLEDTDEDTIFDADEIKLGLDPNNPETFGYPDTEYISFQSIEFDSKVFAEVNTEDNPFKLSLEMESNGYAEYSLSVSESGYSRTIENEAMIGMSTDIEIDSSYNPQNITLKYTIKDEYIDNTLGTYADCEEFQGIKRLNIFKYFEDINMLLPIETQFDEVNNLIYAETDELGTYCVMDMEIWLDGLGLEAISENEIAVANLSADDSISIIEDGTNSIDEFNLSYPAVLMSEPNLTNSLDVAFLVTTYGMDENEITNILDNIRMFSYEILAQTPDSRIFINLYNYKRLALNNGIKYATTRDEVDELVADYEYGLNDIITTNFTQEMIGDVSLRDTATKYGFVVLHSSGYMPSSPFYDTFEDDVQDAIDNNINISTIYDYPDFVGSDSLAAMYNSATGGETIPYGEYFYKDMLKHIYGTHESSIPTYEFLVGTRWKSIQLDGELNATNGINSDTDSLTDWQEVNTSLLKWNADGSFELPTFSEAISIADYIYALNAFERWKGTQYEIPLNDILDRKVLPILSDPTEADSDEDYILDPDDDKPLKYNPWEPETDFAHLVQTAGFSYDPAQDIIYSNMYNVQRFYGFAEEIDYMAAFPLLSQIECEPVKFIHEDTEYLIELWKGQYGLMTGAEVGIYHRPANAENFPSIKHDSIFKWILTGMNVFLSDEAKKEYMMQQALCMIYESTKDDENPSFYSANDEMLEYMSFDLYGSNGKELLYSRQGEHWWMAGFEWGVYTEIPANLSMDIEINFKDSLLADSFAKKLKNMGYDEQFNYDLRDKIGYNDTNYYYHSDNTVRIIYNEYVSEPPQSQIELAPMLKDTTLLMVNFYNGLYEYKGLKDKDPNNLTVQDWKDYVDSLTAETVEPWLDECTEVQYTLEELKELYDGQLNKLVEPVKYLYEASGNILSNKASKTYEDLVDIFEIDLGVVYDYATGNTETGLSLYDYYDNWYNIYLNYYGNSTSKMNYHFYTSTTIITMFLCEQLSNLSYKSLQ